MTAASCNRAIKSAYWRGSRFNPDNGIFAIYTQQSIFSLNKDSANTYDQRV